MGPSPIDANALSRRSFQLGEWVVEPDLGRLTRAGDTVGLELKAMSVLLCLARCSGNLVTRQDLIDAVWATEFISDNTLTHAIAELRSALGDDAKSPFYIETIHRRGYRLMVGASESDNTQTDTADKPSCFHVVVGDRSVRLANGENLIGRIPWATVTIDSLQVSRRHALIVVENACAILEDLDSKNGTYLNGLPLEDPACLEHGDQIGLGSHIVVLQLVATVTTEEGDTPTDPALEA
jgi:DNA-binding winged helix-turn-helix (wHTH) protein